MEVLIKINMSIRKNIAIILLLSMFVGLNNKKLKCEDLKENIIINTENIDLNDKYKLETIIYNKIKEIYGNQLENYNIDNITNISSNKKIYIVSFEIEDNKYNCNIMIINNINKIDYPNIYIFIFILLLLSFVEINKYLFLKFKKKGSIL
jgi:hypothetical protein